MIDTAEIIESLKKKTNEIEKSTFNLSRDIRRVREDIIRLEKIYGKTSKIQSEQPPIPYSKVSYKAIMLGSLLSIGGEGFSREWTKEAKFYSKELHTKIPDSSYPSKLYRQALIKKNIIDDRYRYEIKDYLYALNIVKRESLVFNNFKQKIKENLNLQDKLFQNMVLNYSKKHNSFHIRNEFIKDLKISTDEEFKSLLEDNLGEILKYLDLTNKVSLTEGLNGVLVSGRPIAIVTYHGAEDIE